VQRGTHLLHGDEKPRTERDRWYLGEMSNKEFGEKNKKTAKKYKLRIKKTKYRPDFLFMKTGHMNR
jgi:hypothetical protein